MKFKIEKRGQNFMVVNETTGVRKGTFTKEGEAKVYQQRLQQEHDDGIARVSASVSKKRTDFSEYE